MNLLIAMTDNAVQVRKSYIQDKLHYHFWAQTFTRVERKTQIIPIGKGDHEHKSA
jgi:hypothetical protein